MKPIIFSISHCGDYAGVIVSKNRRVGIDIELVKDKIERIKHKFLETIEWERVNSQWPIGKREKLEDGGSEMGGGSNQFKQIQTLSTFGPATLLTLLWSCKEAVFKWYGLGEVDFKQHMEVKEVQGLGEYFKTQLVFKKNEDLLLDLHCQFFDDLVLSFVVT